VQCAVSVHIVAKLTKTQIGKDSDIIRGFKIKTRFQDS